MSSLDNSLNRNLNSTKDPNRPSHEALEGHTADATDVDKDAMARLNRIADEAASRSTNRIHNDEGTVPGSQEFTK